MKLWDSLKDDMLDPRQLVKKRVGDGKKTCFWSDWWVGEMPLILKYPRVYNLDPFKNDSVYERLNRDGNFWSWKDSIRDGRTKEDLNSLLSQISSISITGKEDYWFCPDGPKEQFTVAWMRQKLIKKYQKVCGKNRWSKWIPKKSNILVWRICKGRVAVKETLTVMQATTGNTSCDVCKDGVESILHTFWDCPFAKDIWSKIKFWWRLQDKRIHSIEEALDWLEGEGANPKEKKALFAVAAATFSSLWLNRNEATFLDKTRKVDDVFSHIQAESFLWIDSRAPKTSINRSSWLFSPRIALKM